MTALNREIISKTRLRLSAVKIVHLLIYYDIFKHPLTFEEIRIYAGFKYDEPFGLHEDIETLVANGLIFKLGSYYSVRNDAQLETKKTNGIKKARVRLRIARFVAWLIFQFPFIRSVMISGSLSKIHADDTSDIDFFIITSKNRLWIARTLLVLFRKVAFMGSHKYFCINYFISEDNLGIKEKDYYIATEIVTLKPLQGNNYYYDFINSNKWIDSFFPNWTMHPINNFEKQGFLKLIIEIILKMKMFDPLEGLFSRIYLERCKRRSTIVNPKRFDNAYKSTPYESRGHAYNYHESTLKKFNERVVKFNAKIEDQ